MVVSSSGLETACCTASSALSSPFASPIPMWAIPFVGHNGLNICEVEVDECRQVDQVCDALYGLLQNLVCFL